MCGSYECDVHGQNCGKLDIQSLTRTLPCYNELFKELVADATSRTLKEALSLVQETETVAEAMRT